VLIRVIAVFVGSDAILLGKVAVHETLPASYRRLPANRRGARQARVTGGHIGQIRADKPGKNVMAQRFSRQTLLTAVASGFVANACANRVTSLQRGSSTAVAAIQARVAGRIGAYMRDTQSGGDPDTRLDRTEVELNTNTPGDPRDTTTPQAMVDSMEKATRRATAATAPRTTC
jgi:hypothetical protein